MALQLDGALAEAHCVLAHLKFVSEYDWTGAEREFRTALELSPNSADTLDLYGRMLTALGRHDEALAAVRRAAELDPLAHRSDEATILLRAGRYDEALRVAARALALSPDYDRGHATLAWAYLLAGAGVGMETMDMGGGRMMAMAPEWTLAYGLVVFLMWAVMMVAMMLPSAAPVTLLVAAIARKRREAGGTPGMRTAPFVLGYLGVWFAFATAATLLQWRLDAAGLLSETMALASMVIAGGVLVLAGIYQWTPLKQACLRHCRSPLQFLMQHWRDGALGALASGAHNLEYRF